MAQASIKIEGVDKLVKKLGMAAAISTLRPPMEQSVQLLERDMAFEPPPRRGSSYIRGYGYPGRPATSEHLSQSWTTKVTPTPNGLEGKIGNPTSYGPWVQSQQFQAWMHKGRWRTDQQVMSKNRKQITELFRQAIDRALR